MGDERTVTWLRRSSRPTCEGQDGDSYFLDVLLLMPFLKTEFVFSRLLYSSELQLQVMTSLSELDSVSLFLLTGGKMCFTLKTVQRRDGREKKELGFLLSSEFN